jgi:hypothetical protein
MDFLDELNIYHYNFSAASEMVALDFIMEKDAFGTHNDIPLCSSSTMTRAILYTAACGIWTRCSYKLPDPIEVVCDTGWNGAQPHYSDGSDNWVDNWKWQSCGEVCCRKVFELCRVPEDSGFYFKINALTKERYPGSECSKQGDFYGNRPSPTDPNTELPCEDGC